MKHINNNIKAAESLMEECVEFIVKERTKKPKFGKFCFYKVNSSVRSESGRPLTTFSFGLIEGEEETSDKLVLFSKQLNSEDDIKNVGNKYKLFFSDFQNNLKKNVDKVEKEAKERFLKNKERIDSLKNGDDATKKFECAFTKPEGSSSLLRVQNLSLPDLDDDIKHYFEELRERERVRKELLKNPSFVLQLLTSVKTMKFQTEN